MKDRFGRKTININEVGGYARYGCWEVLCEWMRRMNGGNR